MFTVVQSAVQVPLVAREQAFLICDNWDDWFSFRTTFSLVVFDNAGTKYALGLVKIGQAGLRGAAAAPNLPPGTRTPNLPGQFPALQPEHFFSLGQDEDYYATLGAMPDNFGQLVLQRLCDCAFDLAIFARHQHEPVMSQSLLRSVHEPNVRNRLHRLARGNAVLTRFEFDFTLPGMPANEAQPATPTTMRFLVEPNSEPPTNLHVIVGRNGAGKTRCIQSLINTLLERPTEKAPLGLLRRLGLNQDEWTFAGLISVSFSAFDDFVPPAPRDLKLQAAFVGLRHQREVDGQVIDEIKGPAALASDFVKSLERCREEPRRTRWLRAISTLAADPLFAEIGVERLVALPEETWQDTAAHYFARLSSGHAIVLLTTTRLVELVDERTLVVLDEPEGHLHPPLLSAFVRAMADLLVARNGVALIATHSPVVLQEVPRRCVWMLRRTLMQSTVERPSVETFGESAGVLTREVFGLEVTKSGFHQLVSAVASEPGQTYDGVEQHFGGQLGSEAKALARSVVATRVD
ncbi:ATP-binding protein [Cupriavidus taiwanensis]|nr:ATP-binding protein [Cupriavidus taiwanensis]